jgi:hypothetical protein
MIQPSGSVIILLKWGSRGHWGHWGCWGCRGHWGCKGSKALKITSDDYNVIQVHEFSFILMFWKQIFFVRIMKYQVEFWHLLSWRLLRPDYVTFFENWWMKVKCPNLLKPLGTMIQQNYWSCYPSEPFSFVHFNMIHPVNVLQFLSSRGTFLILKTISNSQHQKMH